MKTVMAFILALLIVLYISTTWDDQHGASSITWSADEQVQDAGVDNNVNQLKPGEIGECLGNDGHWYRCKP